MPSIAFEGLDGVGKTTMAEVYAEAVGGIAVASLPLDPIWKTERHQVNAGNDVEARFDYFVRLNMAQMALAQEVMANGQIAVLDSTICRTVATHRVLGLAVASRCSIPDALRPTRGFLLQVPDAVRTRRLVGRDGSLVHSSHWDELLYERREQLQMMFQRKVFGLMRINATQPPPKILERILPLTTI